MGWSTHQTPLEPPDFWAWGFWGWPSSVPGLTAQLRATVPRSAVIPSLWVMLSPLPSFLGPSSCCGIPPVP